MKISFIRPNVLAKRTGSAIQPLAFAILKALTPEDVDLELYDEQIEDIPERIETDLIAMTVHTFTAFRAYQLADKFRKQNIPVVMGGFHPSLMPEEAIKHAEAVVIGDAEKVWPQVVKDAKNGDLKQFYEDRSLTSLQGIHYDRSIFIGKKYNKVLPAEFNRGCKYKCDFCSVCVFHHHKVKSRPVHEVIEELNLSKKKYISFMDDNICSNKDITKELFEAMIPLKKRWGCQISIDALKDETFIKLMAKSGCVAVMVGFESLNSENLEKMKKRSNLKEDYIDLVNKVKKHGIMVWGSFVFGYDHDENSTIKETYDFATKSKLYLANFNTLNPLPGTELYQRLKQEKRLLEEHWWLFEKYKYGEIMFEPKTISIPELKKECINIRLKFNAVTNILYRALDMKSNCRNLTNLSLFLASNIMGRNLIHSFMNEIRYE
jgi:radical SAM superfamily enzyme YgiQ (UPF0313 family)